MTDKKVDTWMPLLVDKYLGDTTDLTTEQHGAYLLLLMSCWKKGGALPADEGRLRSITKLDPKPWAASRALLLAFFERDGEVYRQKRLTAELVRAQVNLDQKSAAGKASAAARKAAREANEKATGVGTGVATAAATEDATAVSTKSRRLGKPTPTPSSLRSGISKASPSHPPAEGRFAEFWSAWPKNERKQDRKACLAKWKLKDLDPQCDALLTDLAIKRQTTKWQDGFIEAPLVYLNNDRWLDGVTPDDGKPGEAAKPWHDTRSGIVAKGIELGLGGWVEAEWVAGKAPDFVAYRTRVYRAAGHREAAHA